MNEIQKTIVKKFFYTTITSFYICFVYFFVKLTSKINYINLSTPQFFWKNNKPFILAFWHSHLMMISYSWKSKKKIYILASSHSDGRFGSIVGKYFNLNNIPTSIDGSKLMIRNIYKKLKENSYIGITPDGPRGPKEVVSEGIIRLARATNTPIIACGFSSSKNFRLKSWDSFLVTLPFSTCWFVWQKPLYIPKETKDTEIKQYQKLLKKMINNTVTSSKKN